MDVTSSSTDTSTAAYNAIQRHTKQPSAQLPNRGEPDIRCDTTKC